MTCTLPARFFKRFVTLCGVVTPVVALCACTSVRQEVEGPHGVQGYRSVHALFYVIPVGDGVVLVDAGFDPSGAAVREAVAGRAIKAAFITHSHVDHWSGAHVAGDAPVYVSVEDGAAMRGEREHQAIINHIADHQWPRPELPANMRLVNDGDQIVVDEEVFIARVLPGHTEGSVAWQWRDVLFSGDAVLGDEDGVAVGPPLVSDDRRRARRSVGRLWGEDIGVLLDGHNGRSDGAAQKLSRFVADKSDDP
jgi:hydroxyacylglutathione hydrolase